jgi:hypothetical protein
MPEYYDPVKHLGNPINHQKMYDFERDILRVKNPLNTDFTFIYDQIPITVPANGTRDMERYLVRRFIWNMIGHIYNQITEKKYAEAEANLKKTNPLDVEDPYFVNEKIWLRIPRADNPEFQQKIIKDCVVCVVSKFGANRQLPLQPKNGQLDPNTPLYDQLINDFKMVGVPEEPAQPLASEPLPTAPATAEDVTI